MRLYQAVVILLTLNYFVTTRILQNGILHSSGAIMSSKGGRMGQAAAALTTFALGMEAKRERELSRAHSHADNQVLLASQHPKQGFETPNAMEEFRTRQFEKYVQEQATVTTIARAIEKAAAPYMPSLDS